MYYEALTEKTREVEVQATDPNTGLPLYDSQGKPVMETKTETYKDGEMRPCYATDNAWKKLSLVDFFQKKGSGYSYTSTQAENEDKTAKVYDGFAKTEQPDDQWIKDLDENTLVTSIWHLQPIQMVPIPGLWQEISHLKIR